MSRFKPATSERSTVVRHAMDAIYNLNMSKSLFLSIIPVLLLPISYAQSYQDKELTQSLDDPLRQRFASVAPGCVVLVVKNGETIYKKALEQQM